MLARQPVERVIQKAEQAQQTKLAEQLKASQSIREFSVRELQLPNNQSYRKYVALEREFPVWTVVAAEEFSVEPKQWCYLVIGCASYRGYFQQERANEYAESLRKQGLEVTVGGAPAYSTLGWFDDPLLPSMFKYGEAALAETVFHELAHQVLYVNNNSDFNEAFATLVGERGAELWLQQHRPELLGGYQQRAKAYQQFLQLLNDTRNSLEAVYTADITDPEKRAQKKQQFTLMREQYEALKNEQWQGRGWFDSWFAQELNNARLTAIATYRDRVPEFAALLSACEQNFAKFYNRVEQAAKQNPGEIPNVC